MLEETGQRSADLVAMSVPVFWPMALAAEMASKELSLTAKNFKFLEEELKLHGGIPPSLATPNTIRIDLRTMALRDYGSDRGIPALIDAPFAGHTAMIADYHDGQSLVQTLLANGIAHVCLTDWKSATEDMKDLDIDNYLEELLTAIDDLGGRVNLIGLCQGGWQAAMLAARFPNKVNTLVLAGAPIDTRAGSGPVKDMAETLPLSFYEELVQAGGGLMPGKFMLRGWKSMHPGQHYFKDHVDLYEHIDDPAYIAKEETFKSWYENPIDLPGRWYLQVIAQIFKGNCLAQGEFTGLGRKLDLRNIDCPVYLLGGESDDITPPEQVLGAARYIGTPKGAIVQKTVPGGHIGLFMGARTLKEHWPPVARWIAAHS
jgi:polyhydroxyalkanoate depolymerase